MVSSDQKKMVRSKEEEKNKIRISIKKQKG